MADWTKCSAVERNPYRLSGAWVFKGTRIPLYALYENLASGASIDDFVEWFQGVTVEQARSVLDHEAHFLRTSSIARRFCSTSALLALLRDLLALHFASLGS